MVTNIKTYQVPCVFLVTALVTVLLKKKIQQNKYEKKKQKKKIQIHYTGIACNSVCLP